MIAAPPVIFSTYFSADALAVTPANTLARHKIAVSRVARIGECHHLLHIATAITFAKCAWSLGVCIAE